MQNIILLIELISLSTHTHFIIFLVDNVYFVLIECNECVYKYKYLLSFVIHIIWYSEYFIIYILYDDDSVIR